MDILGILLGGLCGGLAGWSFAMATVKRHHAHRQYLEAIESQRKLAEIKKKAKTSRLSTLTETMQGYLLYSFGILALITLAAMMLYYTGQR